MFHVPNKTRGGTKGEPVLFFSSCKKATMLALNKYFEINLQKKKMVRKGCFICFQHEMLKMTSKDLR